MFIRTKHFGLQWEADWNAGLYRKWWKRTFRIGFVQDMGHEYGRSYKYIFGCDFWLIPCFIWYRDWVFQDHRLGIQPQDRIIGIKNWPFKCWYIHRP